MKRSQCPLALGLALACAAITFGAAVCAQAQTFTDLAYFNGNNGQAPLGSVIQATDGNFYGITMSGGTYGYGNVFQLTPAETLSSIYSFCSQANCADGLNPRSGPILGSDGNLYGVTYFGGNSTSAGTFYKMTISGKITTLYSFCPTSPCADGQGPNGVVQASNGNFYGTTYTCAKSCGGTIFEITSAGNFKLLYRFCSRANCVDGANPTFPPIQASNGNFYGTTFWGGADGGGVVYEMTPAGTYKVLYNFCSFGCRGGSNPTSIAQDANGNLFGTTNSGGSYGLGNIFEITTTNQYIVLHWLG
jgi:uncharacterized repeat protein (TIGR03803 family)